jgi:DNA invertase Pin-like site-specific DNA recombinase
LKRLESKQVKLHVLDQQIDTSTATGMFFTTVLAAVAAFENELRKERQADGIALAKKRGVQLGRRKSLTQKQVAELRQRRHEGIKIVELMKDFGISKASVYRALETTED